MLDASLTVLRTVDHEVSRRGAYLAYVGSGEHAVRLRVLGAAALRPGTTGAVRLHLDAALPLLPGDRYVLRETGRDETVGGGEVLDIAPVLTASRARPDRDVDRVISERGWVEVDELELLTGVRLAPTVGRWVVAPAALAADQEAVRAKLAAAGDAGLELAGLDERQRALLDGLEDVTVTGMTVRAAGHARPARRPSGDRRSARPAGWRHPNRPARRGPSFVSWCGAACSSSATASGSTSTPIATATDLVSRLLAAEPDGFTVSQFREAAGITRKYAVPLLAELDAQGITRRRGDVRIAGPRLPPR